MAKTSKKTTTAVVEIVAAAPSTALTVIPTVDITPEDVTTEVPVAEIEAPQTARVPLTRISFTGARKASKETIIHSCLWGKERWFAKKRLHSFQQADGITTLVIPTSELSYRDNVLTEMQVISCEDYDGQDNLAHVGGSYGLLNEGYMMEEVA